MNVKIAANPIAMIPGAAGKGVRIVRQKTD
jgi:hypothetical protein